MSFFNPQGIPESALRACPRKRWGGSATTLEEELDILRGYSLVTATTASDVFQMHPSVQFCTQSWLSSSHDDVWWRQLRSATMHPSWDQNKWKWKFFHVIAGLYPASTFKTWRECERLDAHVDMALEAEPDDVTDLRSWLTLLVNVANFRVNRRAKYDEGERMLRRGLEIAGKSFSKELDVMYPFLEGLVGVLHKQGQYQEAEQRC